jgi:hypothetical protein
MSVFAKNFLTLDGTAGVTHPSWSAERTAFAADVLRRSGHLHLRVQGESMLPTLWPGDVVGVSSCTLEEIRPGEIVLALRDSRFFLHRYISTCKLGGFLLRGDSMPGTDPRFPREALLGRLTCRSNATFAHVAFDVMWSRAVGMLLCHCGVIRRVALKLHGRRTVRSSELGVTELGSEGPEAC